MIKLDKKLNYYIFISLRKIARLIRKFSLEKTPVKILYLSDSPRSESNTLIDWYFPKTYNTSQFKISENPDLSQYDLILYDYPRIIFSLSLIMNIEKIAPIHSRYFSIAEISNWTSLYPLSLSSEKIQHFRERFKINMNRICDDKPFSQSWIFGTGPSIESFENLDIEDNAIKIICNSIVKNGDFFKKLIQRSLL